MPRPLRLGHGAENFRNRRTYPVFMRATLPVLNDDLLDRVGVATPCEADWNAMRGDDRVRHCGSCKQNVYDISAMTRAEATALIRKREGRMCVRLLRRPDGTLITQDCWERLRAARRRGFGAFMFALVLIGMSQLALKVAGVFAIANWLESRRAAATQVVAGAMVISPPPVVHEVHLVEPQMPMLGALPPMPELTRPDPKKAENAKPPGKSVTKPSKPTAPKHVMGKMIRPADAELIMGEMEF